MAAPKKKNTKTSNTSKAPIGIAFWLLFSIVMSILFLVNYPQIQKTWNSVVTKVPTAEMPFTTAAGGLAGGLPSGTSVGDSSDSSVIFEGGLPELTPEAIAAADSEFPLIPPAPEGIFTAAGIEDSAASTAAASAAASPMSTAATTASAAASGGAKPPSAAPAATNPAGAAAGAVAVVRTLYFVRVDDTIGMPFISAVKRRLNEKSSSLNDALNALLAGPNGEDVRAGLRTLIPEGSRLLSARVDGSTAYLNFNEAFMFNSFGREGYIAQLRQLVWTATEFSNVLEVQILIEGKTINYLDNNISVKTPLNRNSF